MNLDIKKIQNFYDLNIEELQNHFKDHKIPQFRCKQVWHWVYHHGIIDFNQMLNVPKDLKEHLASHFDLNRPKVHQIQRSVDGTQKWLLNFYDHNQAETVHIPERTRGTLCVSSQIGCTLNCTFCHTGTQRLVRNLTSAEIIGQVMVARDVFNEWPTPNENRHISNIVMMGMGEPLYNYENVSKALKVIMDPEGISISKRKITLSTSGVVPLFEQCARELGVNLAISLHAVYDDLRNVLVPLNKKYPLKDLLKACHDYLNATNSKRITFEYVMIKGVNDSVLEAKELVRIIKGIPAKINLIPFNPWPGSDYETSTPESIKAFAQVVQNAGYASPVRATRGQDILAACGQLKSLSERVSKSKRNLTAQLSCKETTQELENQVTPL